MRILKIVNADNGGYIVFRHGRNTVVRNFTAGMSADDVLRQYVSAQSRTDAPVAAPVPDEKIQRPAPVRGGTSPRRKRKA